MNAPQRTPAAEAIASTVSSSLRADWPLQDTEQVDACPTCGHTTWQVLHAGLRDLAFGAAPGAWTLVQCDVCGCAFLERRPTPQSIARAYATYYTHEGSAASQPDAPGVGARLRRMLANGYRNRLYGSRLRPSLGPIGTLAGWAVPDARARVAREAPGLLGARPPEPGVSRLLDVGSGSGRLLKLARSAGWVAMGVEPDAAACAVARESGLDIIAAQLDEVPASFDARFDRIVLSHVIEHVYDPAAMLRHCRRLLRPDGVLWLETPNLDSFGHAQFGADWRGLEPPRHLVLFRCAELKRLLGAAGFSRIADAGPRDVTSVLFEVSARIREGRLNGEASQRALTDAQRAQVAKRARDARAQLRSEPGGAEYITLLARP